MMKMRLVLVGVVAALVLSASAGFASTVSTYVWDLTEWDCENNPYNPDVPCFAPDELEWQETWAVTHEEGAPDADLRIRWGCS